MNNGYLTVSKGKDYPLLHVVINDAEKMLSKIDNIDFDIIYDSVKNGVYGEPLTKEPIGVYDYLYEVETEIRLITIDILKHANDMLR